MPTQVMWLPPGTNYLIRIRGWNGNIPGEWSDTLQLETDAAPALSETYLQLDASNDPITSDLEIEGTVTATAFHVGTNQVVGARSEAIADAETGYTAGDLDTEAEIIAALNATNGTINSILACLRGHGLIGT